MKAKSIIDGVEDLDDKIVMIVPFDSSPFDTRTEFFARIVDPPFGVRQDDDLDDDFYVRLIDPPPTYHPWLSYRLRKVHNSKNLYVIGDRRFRVLFNQSRVYVNHSLENE